MTWDDPHASGTSDERRALFPVPPPTPTEVLVRWCFIHPKNTASSAALLPRRRTEQSPRLAFELLSDGPELLLCDFRRRLPLRSAVNGHGIYHLCPSQKVARNLREFIWSDDSNGRGLHPEADEGLPARLSSLFRGEVRPVVWIGQARDKRE